MNLIEIWLNLKNVLQVIPQVQGVLIGGFVAAIYLQVSKILKPAKVEQQ